MTQNFLNPCSMLPALTFFNRVFMIVATVVVCSLCGLPADDSIDIKNASRGAEQFINDYLSTPHGSYQAVIAHVVKVVMMEDNGRWLVQSCGDIPM